MQAFAAMCEAIAATTKKNKKVALVAEYFRQQPVAEAAQAGVFLSGRTFAAWRETATNVGGTMLWRSVAKVSGLPNADSALTAAYRQHGDLGAATYEVLSGRAAQTSLVSVGQFAEYLERIAVARGTAAKAALVEEVLAKCTALEAKYAVKIISGEMRIGLRESLVEEAIAKAYEAGSDDVRRANMMLGDIAETLRLSSEKRLGDARMRLFHPLGFMLASPAEDGADAIKQIGGPEVAIQVEDKYDGIRAQAHCGDPSGRVRIFTRTLDDVTESFPELVPVLQCLPEPVVLDGEILAWSREEQRALPFSELQQRLGRKVVSAELAREVPLAYVAFDVLYAGGELTIERSLGERGKMLDGLFARLKALPAQVSLASQVKQGEQHGLFAAENPDDVVPAPTLLRAPVGAAHSAADLDRLFDEARERGNEGLMVKSLASPYLPGRRGKWWLKMKRPLPTLDVVITAAEFGHGKRAGVLSDYTFAVRDEHGELRNVGKAYSGLTDKEIAEMTASLKEHTLVDEGYRRLVEPKVVLEVAFNNMMESYRHDSGYALRFPRIVRIRQDKSAGEIDTLARVKELYEAQFRKGSKQ